MKILAFGYNANNHSWSITSQNICRSFIKMGHDVHIFSTNGSKYFPDDLKQNFMGSVEEGEAAIPARADSLLKEYDINLSYTAPKNFPYYLSRGKKKFGIWAMEFFGKNSLPSGFCKNYKYTDKLLAPSTFCKNVFIENGVPSEHIEIVPHGYSASFTDRKDVFNLKTDRKFKFFVNYGQLHKRKNIAGILDSWGKAFTDKDDVVLVAKLNIKPIKYPFEINWMNAFQNFKNKYKNHAPILVVQEFLPDISDLYRSCNALISLGNEGFNLPVLEAVASRKIPVCLDKGPHLDFTNENSAVYVKCSEARAPADFQYWTPSPYAKMYQADTDDAAEKLQFVFKNEEKLITQFANEQTKIINDYTWDKVAKKIESLSLQ